MESRVVITVLGEDRVGIVATISNFLASHNINIEDITQKILKGNIFAMIMLVDMQKSDIDLVGLRKNLEEKSKELGMKITAHDLDLFNYMHRI
jgi:ACT domain-containing protein